VCCKCYWDVIYLDAPAHARSRQTGLERRRLDQRHQSWRNKYCHGVLIAVEHNEAFAAHATTFVHLYYRLAECEKQQSPTLQPNAPSVLSIQPTTPMPTAMLIIMPASDSSSRESNVPAARRWLMAKRLSSHQCLCINTKSSIITHKVSETPFRLRL